MGYETFICKSKSSKQKKRIFTAEFVVDRESLKDNTHACFIIGTWIIVLWIHIYVSFIYKPDSSSFL